MTAMQQLLKQLRDERLNLPMDIEWKRCYQAIEFVIQNTYIPLEKEQIIATWHNGYNNQSPMIDEQNCGQAYYNETFK